MGEQCSLCGYRLGSGTDGTAVDSKRIFSEREEWDKSFKEREYAIGTPKDLNEIYFKIPWIWERLLRAIVRRPQQMYNEEGAYCLTGVALSGNWNTGYRDSTWCFPDDPEKLIMGHPSNWPEWPLSVGSGGVYGGDAYVMHERCWALATRALDIDLIKENLHLFVKAFYRQSRENGLVRGFVIDEQRYWREPAEEHEGLVWADPEEYARICEKRMSRIEGCLELSYSPRDPFNVPEVRRLFSHPEKIQRPKTKKQKELEMKQTESEPASKTAGKMVRNPRLPRSHPSLSSCKVPAEIILMIMDYLHEYLDIIGLIRVFPQFRLMISQAAWRRKSIDKYVLEEPLPPATALDWRYLYSNVDRLLRKSHGWLFRRRVMDCLKRMEKSFFIEMAQRSK